MSSFLVLVRKQFAESRAFLGIAAMSLFALGWLGVYFTVRIERRMSEADPAGQMRNGAAMRSMGGPAMDFSSTAIEVLLWSHPIIMLPIITWAIARGTASPSGEVEKGTADLILSRPVSRVTYQASQVVAGLLGLAILAGALVAGNQAGSQFNRVESPPVVYALVKPAVNLAALGLAIFGVAFLISSLDNVRWRPTLIASAFTLGSLIVYVVANIPSLEEYRWIEKFSIFTAYRPVDAALKAENLGLHLAILSSVGLAGIALGLLGFHGRDLPSNS